MSQQHTASHHTAGRQVKGCFSLTTEQNISQIQITNMFKSHY